MSGGLHQVLSHLRTSDLRINCPKIVITDSIFGPLFGRKRRKNKEITKGLTTTTTATSSNKRTIEEEDDLSTTTEEDHREGEETKETSNTEEDDDGP